MTQMEGGVEPSADTRARAEVAHVEGGSSSSSDDSSGVSDSEEDVD